VTKDITGVIIYLASPAGAYVNGKDIAVDGEVRYAACRQSKL
jgi:NAD(P)-dependent dehydrogenase (short-subunit alcohol dehydrogenase family)